MVKEAKQEKVLQEIKEQLKRISPEETQLYYPQYSDKNKTFWQLYRVGECFYFAKGVYHGYPSVGLIITNFGYIINDERIYYYRYEANNKQVIKIYFPLLFDTEKILYEAELEFIETIYCDYENMQKLDKFCRCGWW